MLVTQIVHAREPEARLPIKFQDIDFGAADAVHEVEDNHDLLVRGYLDLHGAFERCLSTPRFLVLGYKGSGKSALGQHLALTADALNVRATLINLGDLDFLHFPNAAGNSNWQTAYPAIWSFYFFLRIIDSIRDDLRGHGDADKELDSLTRALEESGHLPAQDLPTALRRIQEPPRDPAHAITGLAGGLDLMDLVQRMARCVQKHTASARHVIVVDGLDEVLNPGPVEFQVLTSLVQSAGKTNRLLGIGVEQHKIIILCRSDLFVRLPGANTAKIREDRAIELNWYAGDPVDSALLRLLNLKAKVSDPTIEDVVSEYFFPQFVSGRPIVQFLLDHTRHTPRDFLRLFTHIQRYATDEPMLYFKEIRQGLKSYSAYFDQEIRNELSGYASAEAIESMLALLQRLGRPQFKFEELDALRLCECPDLDLSGLLLRLFECSGIGLVERDKRHENGQPRYSFRYRNPHAVLNLDAELRIHLGWRRHLGVSIETQEEQRLDLNSATTGEPTHSGRRRRKSARSNNSGLRGGDRSIGQTTRKDESGPGNGPEVVAAPLLAQRPPRSGPEQAEMTVQAEGIVTSHSSSGVIASDRVTGSGGRRRRVRKRTFATSSEGSPEAATPSVRELDSQTSAPDGNVEASTTAHRRSSRAAGPPPVPETKDAVE